MNGRDGFAARRPRRITRVRETARLLVKFLRGQA